MLTSKMIKIIIKMRFQIVSELIKIITYTIYLLKLLKNQINIDGI